jgi:hypothetical protein
MMSAAVEFWRQSTTWCTARRCVGSGTKSGKKRQKLFGRGKWKDREPAVGDFDTLRAAILIGILTQNLQQQASLVEPKSVTQVRDFFDYLIFSHV